MESRLLQSPSRGESRGLQIGGEAVDLVLVVMNQPGMDDLLSNKFKIGGSASAAAGPVGRDAGAETDWKLKAEMLTYSRARGVFAGVDLNGAVVSQDKDKTRLLYGHMPGKRLVCHRSKLVLRARPREKPATATGA